MSLREYERKRHFGETPEPDAASRTRRTKRPIFVVQLHQARARHYDFRLEIDGALKSWAVPKGPSLRVGEKRLAVQVEDHPLAYAKFAGDIPQGHYGAGHVDIFDHGTWTPESEPLAALAKGHLDFILHGEKLRGRWTLVRTHLSGRQPQWLLIKRSDAEADDFVATAPKAQTRRASRTPPPKRANAKRDVIWHRRALALDGARDQPLPAGFAPELCTLQTTPPSGEGWLHETKWDGYRLLADLDAGRVRLRSRNDLDWTQRLPRIAAAIEALPVSSARLDGELIAVGARGHSDFSALQRALEEGADARLRYMLFDLPALAGVDLTRAPLEARKALLADLLLAAQARAAPLAFSTHIEGHGADVFAAAKRHGLEGIVSKRAGSHYTSGRSRDWLKIKHARSDEFVVVGYTAPKGSRSGFGSLLLARVEGRALHYVGRVGSGFDDAQLDALTQRLETLRRAAAVVELPAHVPFSARTVRWVAPRIVVEVAFRGLAKEGLLRQASFLRLREDKNVEDLDMSDRKPARSAPARAKPAPRANGVALTHPERIVFPDTAITKQDVADYYRAVARWMLPELVRRPLSVVRCPDGAGKECFFQKHHAGALGAHVHAIALEEKDGGRAEYLHVEDIEGVLELVQMNTLEFHPWGARIDDVDQPDRLVFDLDPAPGVEWKTVIAAAREVRARLADAGLESFPRLSGGKGVHVVVPIRRGSGWDDAKAFCAAFAETMAAQKPMTYLATASKAKREGRIFIDWLRNSRGATSVASWSLRARAGAPVAMPLAWSELGRTKSGHDFDLARAMRRAKTLRTDPWPGFARAARKLPV